MHPAHAPALRVRDGHHARVTNEELFFDLIYAFAVTQLSHGLVEHLSLHTAVETLVLWFAVWLGWQYTCWFTNWFDPEHRGVRVAIFALMLIGLMMSASIPFAFAEGGLMFAACYVAFQVGRTVYILALLPRGHALRANFQRILGWHCIAAAFWFLGAASQDAARIGLWAIAVACEYFSPMTGFWLPGLGRSRTSDWTIEGAHLAERCQLFVIVALGESVLATGASLAHAFHWTPAIYAALLVTFAGSVALWWIYFGTSSKDATHAISHSPDPGRIGASFHYVHVTLIAGIIVSAVGDHLVVQEPWRATDGGAAAVIFGGPLLFLAGDFVYRRVVYRRWWHPHLAAIPALALMGFAAVGWSLLLACVAATALLVVVAIWSVRCREALLGAAAAPG